MPDNDGAASPKPEDRKAEGSAAMDMEVFAAGKWHGDEYSEQDLVDIVTNFNELRDSVKPFLKLGHSGKEEQPALGWVESLRVEAGKIIASVKDIPQIVFEAIKKKLYNRVSSEIYWNYKSGAGKTYNYVLKAVALLGATVPEVKTLKDLTAYLSAKESADKLAVYEFESNDEVKIINLKEEIEMADDNVKKYEEQIQAAKDAEAAAVAKAAAAEQELKTFKESQIKTQRDASTAMIKEFCEQAVKDGKLPPFVFEAIFPKEGFAISFAEDKAVIPFEVLKSFISKVKVIDFSEKGADDKNKKLEGDKSPGEIVDARARELLDGKKCANYSEAMQRVLREDPKLAEEYAADPGKTVTIR